MQVRVENVSKNYAGMAALSDVSLTVGSGELVALLGPSGSGKTTLLRTIAGLETPDAGIVYFDDRDASESRIQDRGVGFVFQHYALFRHMRVMDNIAFGLRARRKNKPAESEIKRRVLELLDLVQLSGLERRFPAQLSGGQRQRVALARALAIEPSVLLLDEPASGQNDTETARFGRLLVELADDGITIVLVEHDMSLVMEVCHTVNVLNLGRILTSGSPAQVQTDPAVLDAYLGAPKSDLPTPVAQ